MMQSVMLLFLAKGHAKYMVLVSEVSSQEPWLEATGSFFGAWSAWVALLSKSLPVLTGSLKEEPSAAVTPLGIYSLIVQHPQVRGCFSGQGLVRDSVLAWHIRNVA